VSGQANSYPFLYQGMENEFTDAQADLGQGILYYPGDGQFYSAQIARSLSLSGAQSTSGPGGAGPRRAHHGHHHGGGGARGAAVNGHVDAAATADVVAAGGGDTGSSGSGGGTPSSLPGLLEDLYNFFSDLFGGGGGQSLPPNYFVFKARIERARRHPQYPDIDGAAIDIVLNQSPAAPEFCADPHPCNTPPLQKGSNSAGQPEYRKAPPPSKISMEACLGLVAPGVALSGLPCGVSLVNCGSTVFGNPEGPAGCVTAAPYCSATAGIVAACYALSHGYFIPKPPEDLRP